MKPCRNSLVATFLFLCSVAYSQQQDILFHLSANLLPGKKILKVKRDFYDPYLWVLAENNQVYRINSLNQVIDDYTAKFSSYNGLQFIDIAGRSQDTVFIASNSGAVLQYRGGAIDIIGGAGGINAVVNSIGINYVPDFFTNRASVLWIATDSGMFNYNMDTGQIVAPSADGPGRIYEASYRRAMYADSNAFTSKSPDIVNYLPVFPSANGVLYTAYLWEGNPYGFHINTAYFTPYLIYDYEGDPLETNLYWGNKAGLWQINDAYSRDGRSGYTHYLDGINVNKITGMYGLTSFGNGHRFGKPGLIKENLLVGTDNGLYFSSSTYTSLVGTLNTFSLFHDDDLGNVRVNDICVDQTSFAEPICEDGVYVACDNGLYLLRPDYSKYLNTQSLAAVRFKGQADTLSRTHICQGSTITAAVNDTIYTGHTFQWYKNGNPLLGQVSDTLNIASGGEYYAMLYDPCENIALESNHLYIKMISAPVFSFNYPDKLPLCTSTSTMLKIDNNPQYHYRWYTNGVLNGATNYQFIVTQSGKYKVEVSACMDSWVPSKEIEVDLINLPVPVFTADKPKYCGGETAILTVNTPTDPGYKINWYKDGNLMSASQDKTSIQVTTDGNYTVTLNSTIASCAQTSAPQQVTFVPVPIFTFNYPVELRYCKGTPVTLKAEGSTIYQYRWYKDGTLTGDVTPALSITQTGKYKIEVSSCDGSWVPSKEVQVDLIDLPVPVITADKPAYCIGDNATLSITMPADPNYTINWYRDNTLLTANANQTSVITSTLGVYTVTVINKQPNSDGTICNQTFVSQPLAFNPPPAVSIQKIVKTSLCDGQTVDLKVTYNAGTVKWSTGETGDEITVSNSGSYKTTVTTAAGCSVDNTIDVRFLPTPILNIPNVGVCVTSHKTATLTAPVGLASYTWNGQTGPNTYSTDHSQTVTLTVTDANGCSATQQIQVNDECPDVKIPNAFTPNGDGVNDTWNILGLEYDPTALVRVFTRYGQQVYQSKGYGTPWSGEAKGQTLPTGAYYYIINTKNGSQTYSGEVTIIY
jgi:gliding motility-associated-like protein